MKSEERHRLHEHDLQKLTAHAGEYWDRYGNYVLVGLLAAALIAAATIFLLRRQEASATLGWGEFRAAATAEHFANVADDHPGTAVGAWARLQEAESHLFSGSRLLFSDRPAARDDLTQARNAFDEVLSNQSAPPQVRERALYGLARTLEALAGVQAEERESPAATLDEAVAAYEQLLKEFERTLYRRPAEERIAQLKRPSTQEFYAWFLTQNPRPADRQMPQDGLPPGHPPFGDLSFPGFPGMPGEDIAPPRPTGTETELPPPFSATPPTADPRERMLRDDEPIEAPRPATDPSPRLTDPAPEQPGEDGAPARPEQ